MTSARIARFLLGLLAMQAAWSRADETDKPPARIAYLGIHDTTLKQTGEKITAAWFRLENLPPKPIAFALHCHDPDTLVQQPTADGWKTVHWNWCGMGKQAATLEPSESRTWYIDPVYYSGKYGQQLRLGVHVGLPKDDAENNERSEPMLVWSEQVEFPKVDHPPELAFDGAIYRAILKSLNDEADKDSRSSTRSRRRRTGRR